MVTARKFQLLLDPWPGDYDAPIQFDPLEDESTARVETDVETESWQARRPEKTPPPETGFFVDGTLRIDARVLANPDTGVVHGAFCSVSVGAVRVEASCASVETVETSRFLLLGAGLDGGEAEVQIGDRPISFAGHSIPGNTPRELSNQLRDLMRGREARLAERLAADSDIVFSDGPLSYFVQVTAPFVGFVKTLHVPYLDQEHFALVEAMDPGTRTPLFTIADKHDRYSWYQRVAERRRLHHPLAGILRLEVRAGLGLEQAAFLADQSTVWLTRFASTSLRDPRAPQNLLPVGALEEQLRHRMGDPLLVRRAIEKYLLEGINV